MNSAIWGTVVITTALTALFLQKKRPACADLQLPSTQCRQPTAVPLLSKKISLLLHACALIFLSWAVIHWSVGSGPLEQGVRSKAPLPPSKAKMLLLVIDRSGSMADPLPGRAGKAKMALVKEAVTSYLREREAQDLIGLVSFARAAQIESPLSDDRSFLLRTLDRLAPQTVEALNGTALGYAIFKSVYLLVACRAFARADPSAPRANSIVLITDGLEEPHPADCNNPFRSMRAVQALECAQRAKVRTYYVNMARAGQQGLSVDQKTKLIEALRATGGGYFEAPTADDLHAILRQISGEQKMFPTAGGPTQSSLGFWLIAVSLCCVCFSRLLETAVLGVIR